MEYKIVESKINFTKDQQEAITTILDFISAPYDKSNCIIALTGAGGTGKTFVTKYIIENSGISLSTIKACAPTHKACRVLSESIGRPTFTIQSTFGFRLDVNIEEFDPRNPKFNPISRVKLDNIQLLIIDEASMLNANLVNYIVNYCKKREIKIIFIGDSYQLAPVGERTSTAFKICNKLCSLRQIVRQSDDNPIQEILPIIRKDVDCKSFNFVNYVASHIGFSNFNVDGKGFAIVTPDRFKELIIQNFSDEEYTNNINKYKLICYTNNGVSYYNKFIRNIIVKDADRNIITKNDLLISYVTIVNDFNEAIINNSEEYIINDIVSYTDAEYGLKGFLIKFQAIYGGAITKPLFVVDHTDKYSVKMYYNIYETLVNEAKEKGGDRWKKFYKFKDNYLLGTNICNNLGKVIINRNIDYGFALTAHKSQGSTYENVFVDLNNILYQDNGKLYSNIDDILRRIYVACSRPKNKLIICYGK